MFCSWHLSPMGGAPTLLSCRRHHQLWKSRPCFFGAGAGTMLPTQRDFDVSRAISKRNLSPALHEPRFALKIVAIVAPSLSLRLAHEPAFHRGFRESTPFANPARGGPPEVSNPKHCKNALPAHDTVCEVGILRLQLLRMTLQWCPEKAFGA